MGARLDEAGVELADIATACEQSYGHYWASGDRYGSHGKKRAKRAFRHRLEAERER